jgi:hypothetical protein
MSADETVSPSAAGLAWNCAPIAVIAPLMTALSYPNKKPPSAATSASMIAAPDGDSSGSFIPDVCSAFHRFTRDRTRDGTVGTTTSAASNASAAEIAMTRSNPSV